MFRKRSLQGQLTFMKQLLGRDEEEDTQSSPHVPETWVILCLVLRELGININSSCLHFSLS